MNSERPYIEHDGNKYEFKASFTLKRKFDKEMQETYRQLIVKNNFTKNQLAEVEELKKFVEENPNLNPEELDEETQNKLLSLSALVKKLDVSEVYEKYCYLMLKEEYDISKDEFEQMLEELAEDYGFNFISTFAQKVCEKVFTKVEEKKEKKPLPSWMN